MDQIHPLFIVNPAAGRGRTKRLATQLSSAFQGPAEMTISATPEHAEAMAYQGALEGYSPIVAVGGDGTLQVVANGLLRSGHAPPLGIVPAGTGNDLARSLGLPSDPSEATRLIWSGVSGEIDVGVCNERYFLNVGGLGLTTNVAVATHERRGRFSGGKMAYVLPALTELSRYTNPEFVLRLDESVVPTRSLLVTVANGRYFAGGMMISPQADPSDGLFDVCVSGDLSRVEALALLPALYGGWHARYHKVQFYRASTVRIEGPPEMNVQLDGEIVGTLPAEFRIVPRALRIAGWKSPARHAPVQQVYDGELIGKV